MKVIWKVLQLSSGLLSQLRIKYIINLRKVSISLYYILRVLLPTWPLDYRGNDKI